MESILDNFVIPTNILEAGAREDVARMNLELQAVQPGVQVISGFKKDGVPYRFFIHSVYNHQKSLEAGFERSDDIECVEFLVDKRTKPVIELKFLDPDRLRFNLRGEIVGGSMFEAYKRWKSGLDTPGTPLDKWGVLTPSQLRTLNSENVFTIEQLAATPRERVRDIFRNNDEFMQLYERAILFQGNKDMTARANEQIEKLKDLAEQNRLMREEMDFLRAQIKEQREINKVKPGKRGPKRKTNRLVKRQPATLSDEGVADTEEV